ncbi:Hypothetical predicted protein [Mytilus galloprovincialis]|uniref:RUN domain-containing protein n=1 Tax=Mytilus galloprovincialis TaxID=29158 RepID=A0A8B6HBK8_MYTGA|nr:Hypothetical predicted protein [Mytilus galloprovincialis]
MSLSGKIFKKRGPTRDEIIRETKIKRKISSELSSAIKSLQQEHCSTGEAILSSDTANHVCNILEAVFLHGLKNSVVKKLGKYVGLQNGENADQSINFWSFATKFTHKDTTAQLTRLGQITTEIGLCRAWIRVALNDGIITSYVDALMADKKTLMVKHGTVLNKDIPGISRDHPDHKFPSRKSCDNPVLRILRSWSQEIILMSGFTDLLALSWPWDNPGISCEYPENVLSSGPINVLH